MLDAFIIEELKRKERRQEREDRLEVRALRVLAAEADPTTEPAKKHDWVGRSLVSIARH